MWTLGHTRRTINPTGWTLSSTRHRNSGEWGGRRRIGEDLNVPLPTLSPRHLTVTNAVCALSWPVPFWASPALRSLHIPRQCARGGGLKGLNTDRQNVGGRARDWHEFLGSEGGFSIASRVPDMNSKRRETYGMWSSHSINTCTQHVHAPNVASLPDYTEQKPSFGIVKIRFNIASVLGGPENVHWGCGQPRYKVVRLGTRDPTYSWGPIKVIYKHPHSLRYVGKRVKIWYV